jgi:hypothetical protein
MFNNCHILLIDEPNIRQIIKLTPSVPERTYFEPVLTSSRVFAKAKSKNVNKNPKY